MITVRSFVAVSILAIATLFSSAAQATFKIDIYNVSNNQFNQNTIFSDPNLVTLLSGTPSTSVEAETLAYSDGVLNSGALRPIFGPPLALPPTANAIVTATSGSFTALGGLYTIILRVDDVVRLSINNQAVIQNTRFGVTFHTVQLNAGINNFTFEHFDLGGPGFVEVGLAQGNTRNTANFNVLTSAPAVTVPEPSTWLLLILGLTAIGFMQRKKLALAIAR